MTERDPIHDKAIDWVSRIADPGFDDWNRFLAWMEEDPAHAAAYEAVLSAGEAADALLRPTLAPAPLTEPRRAIWRRQAMGGLLAAGIVAAIGIGYAQLHPEPYSIETGPGEHRTVSIGTATIALNGNTRLLLDHHNRHIATLDRGEALFDVQHDSAHPFAVRVGGSEVQDVGTRFDVTRDLTGTRIAVAEGMVVYNPKVEAVRLGPGQTLDSRDGGDTINVARAATSDIGSWRENRLSYHQAPLSVVAADLSRGLGIPITVSPDRDAQRFTGVIAYGGDRARLLTSLGPLLDVGVERSQQGWVLTRKADARRQGPTQ
jgi:transmembrane sensor